MNNEKLLKNVQQLFYWSYFLIYINLIPLNKECCHPEPVEGLFGLAFVAEDFAKC